MIRLIYRSSSVHELMLHSVCHQAGLYDAAGVDVVLEDGTGSRWETASAEETAATVAVGGVVAESLRGDSLWTVHFIATVRPLMWVVGTAEIASVADLLNRRIATPRRAHMPSVFLRLILERHGYDVATDVELVEVDHRPDRQRLLESGQVDAALLGPEGLSLAEGGSVPSLFVGDHIEYPTVGLASRHGLDADDSGAVAAALGQGLNRLREDPLAGRAAIRAIDPQISDVVAERVLHDFVAPYWQGPAWARTGSVGDVPAVAEALGIPRPSNEAVRKLLHRWVTGSRGTSSEAHR